mmetsp:Transcript_1130/g.3466  ORF Transcript_1130/g.3466 Transcript_1130/m.3466 type:complete len:607 (+) Transcript_1130:75-1895(+)
MPSVYEPLDPEFQDPSGSPREIVPELADARRTACPGGRAKVLLASVGVLGLLAVGAATWRGRAPRAASAAGAMRAVQLDQDGQVPCDLEDDAGVLYAMNPCKASIDYLGAPGSMAEIKQELGSEVAELLSGLKVKEKVEAMPWRVVAAGWVDVVQEKGGKAIRAEPHCSILNGIREGGWLKLTNNRGYIEILHKGEVWLQPDKTTYTRITNGTCADNFLFPILEEADCEHAANALEVFDTTVDVDGQTTPVPAGCYITTVGSLRLSTGKAQESYGQIAREWREYLQRPPSSKQVFEVICSSTDSQMRTCDTRYNTTSTTTTTWTMMSDFPLDWGHLPEVKERKDGLASLYCFSMARAVGYEPGLMITQYAKGASIFGCDEFRVFSNGGIVSFGDFDSEQIASPTSVMGNPAVAGVTTNSFLNTMTFLRVWDTIYKEGAFKLHDWVVKVDPDAVFFPERLRHRLVQYTPTAKKLHNPANYFVNCNLQYGPADAMTFGKVFGSLEIYSREAIAAYGFAGEPVCKQMPWQGWGEDFYMQKCMELMGVTHLQDFEMVGDKRCHYAPCTDQTKVAFHDWKTVPAYFDCWAQSLGADGVAEYAARKKQRLQK